MKGTGSDKKRRNRRKRGRKGTEYRGEIGIRIGKFIKDLLIFLLRVFRISLTIVDTPGFGDNIDNEAWYDIVDNNLYNTNISC